MASSSSSGEVYHDNYEMSHSTRNEKSAYATREMPMDFRDMIAEGPNVAEVRRDRLEGDDMPDSFTKSTVHDARNMQRMGHKQQLVRHFRLLSTISFVAIATANWELTVFTMNQGLIDGGRAGLIWSYVWNFFGFLPIVASMAEMASMSPIAGAQYHWVSEFAPARFQKILSFFTGWYSTLAWQAGNAQGLFLTGTLIQTLISINDVTYPFPNWQGTLLVIATTVLVFSLNYFGNRFLPHMQNIILALHTLLYLCLILPVWILAPHTTADVVFTKFEQTGGWPNLHIAVLAGQLSGIAAMTGVDTAAHMAEEVNDASRNVPIAMLAAYFINFAFSLPAIITLCFAMPDLDAALADPTFYPVIYVLRQTMSIGWATAFIAAVVVILFCSNVSYLAAVSRDLFAFARDSGVPASRWVSHVHDKKRIPANSLLVSCVVAIVLSLIYLGSDTAFYALTSLFVVSILQCYMFSIGALLWRRITRPETLPTARWSLGKLGIPCNVAALIYVVYAFFWAFWPQYYNPGASDFNWAVALFGAIAVISGLYYIFRARHIYKGPVMLVEGRGHPLK